MEMYLTVMVQLHRMGLVVPVVQLEEQLEELLEPVLQSEPTAVQLQVAQIKLEYSNFTI